MKKTKTNTCACCGDKIDKSDATTTWCTVIVSKTFSMTEEDKNGNPKIIKGQLMTFCQHCYTMKLMEYFSEITEKRRIEIACEKAQEIERARRGRELRRQALEESREETKVVRA